MTDGKKSESRRTFSLNEQTPGSGDKTNRKIEGTSTSEENQSISERRADDKSLERNGISSNNTNKSKQEFNTDHVHPEQSVSTANVVSESQTQLLTNYNTSDHKNHPNNNTVQESTIEELRASEQHRTYIHPSDVTKELRASNLILKKRPLDLNCTSIAKRRMIPNVTDTPSFVYYIDHDDSQISQQVSPRIESSDISKTDVSQVRTGPVQVDEADSNAPVEKELSAKQEGARKPDLTANEGHSSPILHHTSTCRTKDTAKQGIEIGESTIRKLYHNRRDPNITAIAKRRMPPNETDSRVIRNTELGQPPRSGERCENISHLECGRGGASNHIESLHRISQPGDTSTTTDIIFNRICSVCQTTKSTGWRRYHDGSMVCSACKTYWNRYGQHRPERLWRN